MRRTGEGGGGAPSSATAACCSASLLGARAFHFDPAPHVSREAGSSFAECSAGDVAALEYWRASVSSVQPRVPTDTQQRESRAGHAPLAPRPHARATGGWGGVGAFSGEAGNGSGSLNSFYFLQVLAVPRISPCPRRLLHRRVARSMARWSASFEGPTGGSCEGGVAEAVLERAGERRPRSSPRQCERF